VLGLGGNLLFCFKNGPKYTPTPLFRLWCGRVADARSTKTLLRAPPGGFMASNFSCRRDQLTAENREPLFTGLLKAGARRRHLGVQEG